MLRNYDEEGCPFRLWGSAQSPPPECKWKAKATRDREAFERHEHVRTEHTPTAAQWTEAYRIIASLRKKKD